MKPHYLLAATVLANPVHGFFRNLMFGATGRARVDPIVNPGTPSQHEHFLSGASNIGLSSTAETLSESTCTNSQILLDKSAYWSPTMYFAHENGTFLPMTIAGGLTTYYKYEQRPLSGSGSINVFPKGLRMIAGTSSKRTWDSAWPVPDMSNWGPQDITQAALAEKALGFNCLNYDGSRPDEGSFEFPYMRDNDWIKQNCHDGIRAELLFPSCWDGKNLDSSDHKSHLAYPTLLQDGTCTDTHPVKLPIMFFEVIWNTQAFKDMPGSFVFSNGDETGYGFHGDFMAAWDDGIQEKIMSDPTCTGSGALSGDLNQCQVFSGHIQPKEDTFSCKMVVPSVLENEVDLPVYNKLPGNVAITGVRHDPGSQVASSAAATTSASVAPSSASIQAQVAPSTSTSSTKAQVAASTSPSPVKAPVTTPAPSSAVPVAASISTLTTTFTQGSSVVVLLLVEEVDTVTVTAGSTNTQTLVINDTVATPVARAVVGGSSPLPLGNLAAVHRHKHGRRRGIHNHGHL